MDGKYSPPFLLKLGNSFLSSHHPPPPPPPPPPVFLHLFSPKKKSRKSPLSPRIIKPSRHSQPHHLPSLPSLFGQGDFSRDFAQTSTRKMCWKNLGFFLFSLLCGKTRGERMARVQLFFSIFLSFSARFPTTIKCFRHSRGSLFDSLSSSLFFPLLFLVHWFLAIWPPPKPKRTTTIFPQKRKREERKGTFSSFGPTNWNKKVACTGCCTRAFPNNKKGTRAKNN